MKNGQFLAIETDDISQFVCST